MVTEKVAHLYQAQECSQCAALIRHIQHKFATVGTIPPRYYRAQYMLLLATCEPEDEAAHEMSLHARKAFQHGFSEGIIAEETRHFLKTLALISASIQGHIGGYDEHLQKFMKHLGKQVEILLTSKTLKELGLEALMVHHLLVADTTKRTGSLSKDFISQLEQRDNVEEQRKLRVMVAEARKAHEQKQFPESQDKKIQDKDDRVSRFPQIQQGNNIAEDAKRLSPYEAMARASPFHRQPRASASARHSHEGM